MSDTDPVITPNHEDPRADRLRLDGVDPESPDFDAEQDRELHPNAYPEDEKAEDEKAEEAPAPAPAKEPKAKTGSIPVQSADASTDSSAAKS